MRRFLRHTWFWLGFPALAGLGWLFSRFLAASAAMLATSGGSACYTLQALLGVRCNPVSIADPMLSQALLGTAAWGLWRLESVILIALRRAHPE